MLHRLGHFLASSTPSRRTTAVGQSSTTRSRTTRSGSSTATTTREGVCVKIEAMNRQNGVIDEIYLEPALKVDVDDLIPGQKGVNFPESALYPNITILLSRVGEISFLQVPPESYSNVAQIQVEFYNGNDTLISTHISPANLPKLEDGLKVENVVKIVIRIVATIDGKSPKKLTIDIIGCFFNGKTYSTLS